jgi:predicted DNA binding CopG/RHH family protein
MSEKVKPGYKQTAVGKMKNKHDQFESEMIEAYEKGEFLSTNPSKAELAKFRSAAQITFIKDRRVNIRLTSPDFMDIQARALEEGIPCQTLIASVLHKLVAVRLVEKSSRITSRTTGRAKKLRVDLE